MCSFIATDQNGCFSKALQLQTMELGHLRNGSEEKRWVYLLNESECLFLKLPTTSPPLGSGISLNFQLGGI